MKFGGKTTQGKAPELIATILQSGQDKEIVSFREKKTVCCSTNIHHPILAE